MTIELKSLVGLHSLTGVDFLEEPADNEWSSDNSSVCRFVLDGDTYIAKEDPSDGYRSCMEHIIKDNRVKVKNQFQECRVMCIYNSRGTGYSSSSDLLEMYDSVTGEMVLTVGTDNDDDYYPSFVANFTPEAMAANK